MSSRSKAITLLLHPPLRPLPQHLLLRLLPPLRHRRRPPRRLDPQPGLITDLVFFLASKFLKTISLAAATTCYVAMHPRLENVSGKYLADCNEASTCKLGSNSTEAGRLWSVLELMPARSSQISLDSTQRNLNFLWIQPRENSNDQTNIHVYPDWLSCILW
ncbi:unnamed protein product [Camellia sinensis]